MLLSALWRNASHIFVITSLCSGTKFLGFLQFLANISAWVLRDFIEGCRYRHRFERKVCAGIGLCHSTMLPLFGQRPQPNHDIVLGQRHVQMRALSGMIHTHCSIFCIYGALTHVRFGTASVLSYQCNAIRSSFSIELVNFISSSAYAAEFARCQSAAHLSQIRAREHRLLDDGFEDVHLTFAG